MYADQLKTYLKEFKPGMVKELKARGPGALEKWCRERGQEATEQKYRLMDNGMREYEAEEIVRSQLFPAP